MMCLAVPAKLLRTNGVQGLADLHGNRLPISTVLVPEAQPGDWVLVHAGFAIQKLVDDEARQTFSLIQELAEPSGGVS